MVQQLISRPKPIVGKTVSSNSLGLAAVTKCAWLFLSRQEPTVIAEKVKGYVQKL